MEPFLHAIKMFESVSYIFSPLDTNKRHKMGGYLVGADFRFMFDGKSKWEKELKTAREGYGMGERSETSKWIKTNVIDKEAQRPFTATANAIPQVCRKLCI